MQINQRDIDNAIEILLQGGIVAFPTESSYGLAVDVRNEAALRRLYAVKGRPNTKPLLVLVAEKEEIVKGKLAAFFPEEYEPLVAKFWPGALTLIFPAHSSLSEVLTAGSGTVGVRISPHPVACALVAGFAEVTLANYHGAITATSANISGAAPCKTAEEVREMFGETIDYLLDGGLASGAPSTLVGLDRGELKVIRQGQIAL